MISKDMVILGLKCKLDYKVLQDIATNHQLELEKHDYYNCDLYLNIIDKVINKEIDMDYFTTWCVLVMASLETIPVKYKRERLRKLYEKLAWYFDGVAFMDEYDVYELKKIKAEVRYYDHQIMNIKNKKNDLFLTRYVARCMLYDHYNPCLGSDVYRVLVLDTNNQKFSFVYFDEYMYEYKDDVNYSFIDDEETFEEIFYKYVLDDDGWIEETNHKYHKYFPI